MLTDFSQPTEKCREIHKNFTAFWSECRDSNSRPLEPHSSAIPNFATPGFLIASLDCLNILAHLLEKCNHYFSFFYYFFAAAFRDYPGTGKDPLFRCADGFQIVPKHLIAPISRGTAPCRTGTVFPGLPSAGLQLTGLSGFWSRKPHAPSPAPPSPGSGDDGNSR